VTAFRSLSWAMMVGFLRDKLALFFAILFPLMFLVLFGGIFSDQGLSKSTIIEVGSVPLIDQAPPQAKAVFDDALTLTHSDNLAGALESVRTGDVDGAVEDQGDRVVLHFSAADPVAAATVRGTFQSIVDAANLAATHQPPKFALATAQVEDESLNTIQFVTPGLLGWAIATGATFGAAATLVSWRRRGLLRRLRLAPVRTESIIAARVGVSLGVAMLQMVIFVGLAMAAFGLQLNGSWYMVVPLLVCGTLAFMSIGLLAGSVAKTEEGATSLANFVVLPMAFLSGSFFSLDDAPVWLKTVSSLLPLKHLNDGMLDVMVRGQGPSAAVKPMVILLGFALVVTLIAARLFQWEAD
jgi:ABC-2 type transport system permease protein